MCLACEEADMFHRWELLKQIADGRMPAGVTEAELRTMGLPLPSEIEVIVRPDGTREIRPIAKDSDTPAFACDSPTS
jgi:hypothetical protein